jgi:hypothetical protein
MHYHVFVAATSFSFVEVFAGSCKMFELFTVITFAVSAHQD